MRALATIPIRRRLLDAPVEIAARAGEELAGELLARLDEIVPQAVAGNPSAVHLYVRHYEAVLDRLLAVLPPASPRPQGDSTAAGSSTRRAAAGEPPDVSRLFLLWGALEAPFAGWVRRFGPGRGTVLGLVERLRAGLGAPPLVGERHGGVASWDLDGEQWLRFRSLVEGELRSTQGSRTELARVRELFDLSLTELGDLFGASRQAATKWLTEGLPPARRAKIQTVINLGELLESKLRPGRLPAVARRLAAAYGDRSILERIALDEQEDLLAEVEASFDWAATA